MSTKRLYRSEKNKMIAGVFGSLGEYANIDPVIFRLLWVLITVLTGFVPGLIGYFVAVIVIPKRPEKTE